MPRRLSELAEPYWVLKDAGYDITLASPNGGAVPVDPASLAGDAKTAEADRMLNDGELLLPSAVLKTSSAYRASVVD
jgi:putative intracellular protease/amidase